MKVSDNFDLRELVCREHWELIQRATGEVTAFLHPAVVPTLELLRDTTGPISINTWHRNGSRQYSGTRPMDCLEGAAYSMHKLCCAFDGHFKVNPIDVQTHILENQDLYPYITRMEDARITRYWVHMEFGSRDTDIKVFIP